MSINNYKIKILLKEIKKWKKIKKLQKVYHKIDFNKMSDEIFDIIAKSKSQKAKEEGFALAMQYQIFSNYLIDIIKNAIETENKVVLFALHQIGVLTDVEDKDLDDWQSEYEKFSEHLKSPKKGD